MKTERETMTLAIIAGLLAVIGIALCVKIVSLKHDVDYLQATNSDLTVALKAAQCLPCLADIQERIGVKPDNIYGEKTRQAWDLAYCSQEAKTYDYYYQKN
jgi:hypothetical protein